MIYFIFIVYHYSLTRFGRFCHHHKGVIQEYKQYKNTFHTFCMCIYILFVFLWYSEDGRRSDWNMSSKKNMIQSNIF